MRMSFGDVALTPEIVAFFCSAIKELYSYFVTAISLKKGIGVGTEEIVYTVANSITVVYSVRVVHVCFVLVVPMIAAKT